MISSRGRTKVLAVFFIFSIIFKHKAFSKFIKEICGNDFLTVTPGIRPQGADTHDQARIATPADAARMGSDFMVIGRRGINLTQG